MEAKNEEIDLTYWAEEGARRILNELINEHRAVPGMSTPLEVVHAQITRCWEQSEDVRSYCDRDMIWVAAGVSLQLYERGCMARTEVEKAFEEANWDPGMLRDPRPAERSAL